MEAYRTGEPGRPTSKQLVEREHARRLAAGQAHEILAEEARYLVAWLLKRHPEAPSLTVETIQNRIRTAHRRGTKSPTK
jgi:hypothetical protein